MSEESKEELHSVKSGGWVENAPRAGHYLMVGTSAVSNLGPLPVIAFAYQTLDDKTITVSMIMQEDTLKKWKQNCLRAYDEALRQVKILTKSLEEIAEEDVANDK